MRCSRPWPARHAPTRSATARSSCWRWSAQCASAPARPTWRRSDAGLQSTGDDTMRMPARVLAGAGFALLAAAPAFAQEDGPKIDTGDTAWMLTSTALVLMMTIPGLALFYAGMVRKK